MLGVIGSIVIAGAFGRGSYGDGWDPVAFLTVMFASMLGLVLALCLLLMVALTMEGLADLIVHTARLSAAPPAPAATWANGSKSSGWRSRPPNGPGPATLAQPVAEAVIGQLATITEVVEHIRLGPFVKVTTSDGVTGWVRDTDLPPTSPGHHSPLS